MRLCFAAALLIGAFCALRVTAATAACLATSPQVTVTPVSGTANIDNGKTQSAIQSLSGIDSSGHGARGPMALGLTLTQVMTSSRLTVAVTTPGWGGSKCASLQAVSIDFGFSPHTIYIPSEFAPNTCAYNAIYSHEIQHVNADLALLNRRIPGIRASIATALSGGTAVEGDDTLALQKIIKDRLETVLTRLQADFTRERQAAQALIDSPGEYARVGNSCGGIMQKVVKP